jgi:predicted Zn finger-like uncharacterized protein
MTLICPQCESRLQLDDDKTPAQPFTVRCPKCQAAVKLQANAGNETAARISSADRAGGFQLDRQLAPRFKPANKAPESAAVEQTSSPDLSALANLFASMLKGAQGLPSEISNHGRRQRKALLCVPKSYQGEAASLLSEHNYEVFVPENTAQALGTMREDRIDVVLLDANFDPVEQGTAFVLREINLQRPARRRRLFLVYFSSALKTMDLHAAFLHNVNLVFNPADLARLPEFLEMSLRNYNDLYHDFFSALSVQAI